MSEPDREVLTGRAASKLCASLRRKITSEEIAPGEFLPSVRRLGSEYGLAPRTVLRALRSLADEGLLVAQPRQGYLVQARPPEPVTKAPIAFVLGNKSDSSTWGQNLQGFFGSAASARGLSLLVVDAMERPFSEVVEQVREARARGALVDTSDPALLEAMKEAGIPVVAFDCWLPEDGVDSVVQDGFQGGMQAAACLAARGHRRIAWLGPKLHGADPQIIERFAGAVGGLTRAGLDLAPDLKVEAVPAGSNRFTEEARELLSRPDRPTAVLALWQTALEGVIAAARELNLELGRDLDVVGWGTDDEYKNHLPSLFAGGPTPPVVVWSVKAMADAAIRRLEERLEHPGAPAVHIRIPTSLITDPEKAG